MQPFIHKLQSYSTLFYQVLDLAIRALSSADTVHIPTLLKFVILTGDSKGVIQVRTRT